MCSQSSNTSSNWHKLHLSSISSSFLRQLHYFSFLGIYGICLVVCSLHLEINFFFAWYFYKFGSYDWMCLLRMSSIQHNMTCGQLALVVHFSQNSHFLQCFYWSRNVFIFKILKFEFAEIFEKKLNYWENPPGEPYCWAIVEIVAFQMLQIFQTSTISNIKFQNHTIKLGIQKNLIQKLKTPDTCQNKRKGV